eukprot:CAMPEP_0197285072 /NCGR_PEP_ID=MMETSP0890-20130614/205_1 /TAXON_ID=44058 ORGANISM="Aureoumbra lagunensis, Strain CCMP1510" /NCGR_SAMPLE_ID=MMETSP0890 /ASSEMBLY_ACC=CAM_ASM_000533 /LENGTH=109 /DNA_ID=CAMNT_0042752225 /DNA_START=73 /DNA_END=402 /DNA_ORIENTATION=-
MTDADSSSIFTGSISDLRAKKAPPHPIVQFCLHAEPHWMFAFTFSHLLFWLVGFQWDPARIYSDNHFNSDGGIPSGPSGSGQFIVTVMLMVVATVVIAAKAIVFQPQRL